MTAETPYPFLVPSDVLSPRRFPSCPSHADAHGLSPEAQPSSNEMSWCFLQLESQPQTNEETSSQAPESQGQQRLPSHSNQQLMGSPPVWRWHCGFCQPNSRPRIRDKAFLRHGTVPLCTHIPSSPPLMARPVCPKMSMRVPHLLCPRER